MAQSWTHSICLILSLAEGDSVGMMVWYFVFSSLPLFGVTLVFLSIPGLFDLQASLEGLANFGFESESAEENGTKQ